jgi:hypothetical protein
MMMLTISRQVGLDEDAGFFYTAVLRQILKSTVIALLMMETHQDPNDRALGS